MGNCAGNSRNNEIDVPVTQQDTPAPVSHHKFVSDQKEEQGEAMEESKTEEVKAEAEKTQSAEEAMFEITEEKPTGTA
ncbi:hypothetical protein RJT34_13370 [Clitoria ternatea]|uniref:Uncharacterized protein n=1 Tax=Clitoria ternatea TaxID=43366 RepID=A0AAN9PK52_CLITE